MQRLLREGGKRGFPFALTRRFAFLPFLAVFLFGREGSLPPCKERMICGAALTANKTAWFDWGQECQ